jgi:hypothetical protein
MDENHAKSILFSWSGDTVHAALVHANPTEPLFVENLSIPLSIIHSSYQLTFALTLFPRPGRQPHPGLNLPCSEQLKISQIEAQGRIALL